MSPRRPRKPCAWPMCAGLVESPERYCDAHRAHAPRYSQTRGQRRPGAQDQDDFHNSTRWRRFRAWYLGQHPLCGECERAGGVVEATIVDHIVPISEGGEELSEENCQAMCKGCHSKKTNAERNR